LVALDVAKLLVECIDEQLPYNMLEILIMVPYSNCTFSRHLYVDTHSKHKGTHRQVLLMEYED
jgi:hypothetical protein